MRLVILLSAMLLCQVAIGQDRTQPLTPAQAAKQVDQQVTVELEVKAVH